MKIRTGFVSNSSSSNYIIIINISPAKFYKILYDEYSSWCIDELTVKIAKNIAVDKNNILKTKKEEQKFGREDWRTEKIGNIESELTRLETTYNTIVADESAESVISAILDYAHIKKDEKANKIKITGFTSMHNNFQDMPTVIKEILLFFSFDTSFAITCYREGQYGESTKVEYVEEF